MKRRREERQRVKHLPIYFSSYLPIYLFITPSLSTRFTPVTHQISYHNERLALEVEFINAKNLAVKKSISAAQKSKVVNYFLVQRFGAAVTLVDSQVTTDDLSASLRPRQSSVRVLAIRPRIPSITSPQL